MVVVRAAKIKILTSTVLPQRSTPAYFRRMGATIEGCINQYKEVPNRSPHVNGVHAFQLLSRFGRSHPLSSKLPAPRAFANVAFALVCVRRQAPSPECVHARANLLPLIMLSFFGHLALESHFVLFPKPDKNGVFETLVHLRATLLKAALRGASKTSRFPGGTGFRDAPPTGVSLHTCAPSQRSRLVVSWAMALYGAS